MSEAAAAVVESQPTALPVMDVSRGPLVDITPEQRTEFRKTGELPKKEEAAASSEPKPAEAEAKPAGDSEPPENKQVTERKPKPAKTADERIAELEATIEKIRKGAGKETPKADSEPAKPAEPPPTRTKPTAEDKDKDGKPKYETYEDFVEDLADWKSEQREAKRDREQAQQAQSREFFSKVDEARTRYENFDEVVQPTATAINTDASIPAIVKTLLSESDVLPDVLFTLGSDPAELAKFVKMARETPGKALRYIALTESLIADELEGKKQAKPAEEPAKPRTKAPPPPSESGGRAAAPDDALEAAARAKDFRAFSAESTRRQLAKMKS